MIPVNAFSTPRGVSARCADVVPVNVSRSSRGYESSLCRVVPFKVFATLHDTKARYAAVIPVSVVLPGAVGCIISAWSVHAFTWPFIKVRAQHALAADAASRRARSCLFQCQCLLQWFCHQSVAAPLKRNPLARHLRLKTISLEGREYYVYMSFLSI